MKFIFLAISAAACIPAFAVTVSHTFSGVTTSNVVEGAIDTEFPIGTKWTVKVEWDSATPPTFTSETQGAFKLTKFTTTLQGKSGVWTTTSLPDQASFSLNKLGSHEMQFTSGWGPEDHTNPVIKNLKPFSINVTLKDPTGTALSSLSAAPTAIDMSQWDIPTSGFKVYLSENGFMAIYGSLQSPITGPEISIHQPIGSELIDGTSTKSYGSVKIGKSKAKTYTIKNAGDKPLKNLSIVVAGKNKKDFSVTAPSKKSIAPGATTTFKVFFKPTAKGARMAAVQVRSNDKDENPFDIKVSGRAVK